MTANNALGHNKNLEPTKRLHQSYMSQVSTTLQRAGQARAQSRALLPRGSESP